MTTGLRDVHLLTDEQAALLWCMRLWVAGRRTGTSVSTSIEQVAFRMDAADAGHFVEGFMDALNRGAGRSIEVGCVRCPKFGADEQLLLDVLALAQERRTFEALLSLRHLVGAAAARDAVQNAEGVGLALARAGRFLPAPGDGGRDGAGPFDLGTWLVPASS